MDNLSKIAVAYGLVKAAALHHAVRSAHPGRVQLL
jgi:hypothetical protein